MGKLKDIIPIEQRRGLEELRHDLNKQYEGGDRNWARLQYLRMYLGGSGGGVDSDAQAFIDAGSFTDDQQTYINTFVLNLKTGLVNGNNIWTDVFTDGVILPLIGGTAANHAINLRSPGSHDTTWVNSPTHNANGVVGGNPKYGLSNYNPITVGADKDNFSYGSYVNTSTAAAVALIGSWDNASKFTTHTQTGTLSYYGVTGANTNFSNASTNVTGLQSVVRTASNSQKFYKGATLLDTDTTASTSFYDGDFCLMCRNVNGTPLLYAINYVFSLFFIGKGMNLSQMQDFDAAVTALQTSLGRAV